MNIKKLSQADFPQVCKILVLRRFVWISKCFCLQINSPISGMKELICRQKHEWLQSVNYLKAIPARTM